MRMLQAVLIVVLLVQNLPAQERATATVEGVVVKAGTNEPVARAIVELRRAGSADARPFTVESVEDGRFAFLAVPAGQYQLAVSRAGFVPSAFGQRRPNGTADTITIASGERKGPFRIDLTPAAALSGRITDSLGRPAVNAEVSASRISYAQGRRTLRSAQSTITNDLGEYRLFWLEPGQYYVSAVPFAGDRAFRFDNEGSDTLRDARMRLPVTAVPAARRQSNPAAATYYPGTTDSDGAAPIDLRPGMDFRGVDFIASSPRTYHIRVTPVDGATGRLFSTARSINIFRGTGGIVVPGGTGAFDYPDALAGRYVVTVTAGDLAGRMSVEVRDRDLDVVVPLGPAFSIPGRIAIEGTLPEKSPNLTAVRINVALDPPIGTPPPGVSASADGSFNLKIPNGAYRINLAAPKLNAYVKSMRLGNVDVLNNGLQVEGQPPQDSLDIVLSANVATLQGQVFDEKQEPIREVTVVLVPDVDFRKRTDLYKTATTDAAGLFQLRDIAPGDYKLFAWDGVETGAWLDPAFLRPFEDQGRVIRVDEGGKHTMQLTVLPFQ